VSEYEPEEVHSRVTRLFAVKITTAVFWKVVTFEHHYLGLASCSKFLPRIRLMRPSEYGDILSLEIIPIPNLAIRSTMNIAPSNSLMTLSMFPLAKYKGQLRSREDTDLITNLRWL